MATSATFVIIIPFLIAVIVFIVVVATRSGRHKHRGANDARNFDDGTTFYPGDAVVNPTSTPPPHEHSPGAAVPPQRAPEATAHPSESAPAAPVASSNPGEIVSDGLMPKGEQSAFKSGRQDPDTSGDPDSITSKARGAGRGEETAGGGPEGGGGGTTGGSR